MALLSTCRGGGWDGVRAHFVTKMDYVNTTAHRSTPCRAVMEYAHTVGNRMIVTHTRVQKANGEEDILACFVMT